MELAPNTSASAAFAQSTRSRKRTQRKTEYREYFDTLFSWTQRLMTKTPEGRNVQSQQIPTPFPSALGGSRIPSNSQQPTLSQISRMKYIEATAPQPPPPPGKEKTPPHLVGISHPPDTLKPFDSKAPSVLRFPLSHPMGEGRGGRGEVRLSLKTQLQLG